MNHCNQKQNMNHILYLMWMRM